MSVAMKDTTAPDESAEPSSTPSGGGGSGRVDPPNITNDPAGYNAGLFPQGASSVAKMLTQLGYDDADGPLDPRTRAFQADYNKVSRKRSKLGITQKMGTLAIDGDPKRLTKRALEIADLLGGAEGFEMVGAIPVGGWRAIVSRA